MKDYMFTISLNVIKKDLEEIVKDILLINNQKYIAKSISKYTKLIVNEISGFIQFCEDENKSLEELQNECFISITNTTISYISSLTEKINELRESDGISISQNDLLKIPGRFLAIVKELGYTLDQLKPYEE